MCDLTQNYDFQISCYPQSNLFFWCERKRFYDYSHSKLRSDVPDVDSSDDGDFYRNYDNEKIKIYSCTVSNRNPVT